MLNIPVSFGEAIDKLTILEIKLARIEDPEKLQNIKKELMVIDEAVIGANINYKELESYHQLKGVNEKLWEVEDSIRAKDRKGEFDIRFIELAQAVYNLNDYRFALKRKINIGLGSELTEEKGYEKY